MTTIIVSYNLKWFLSKSETFCLVLSRTLVTIFRSSIRASSRRQKVSGSRAGPGVSSWVRAVRDVGGAGAGGEKT